MCDEFHEGISASNFFEASWGISVSKMIDVRRRALWISDR